MQRSEAARCGWVKGLLGGSVGTDVSGEPVEWGKVVWKFRVWLLWLEIEEVIREWENRLGMGGRRKRQPSGCLSPPKHVDKLPPWSSDWYRQYCQEVAHHLYVSVIDSLMSHLPLLHTPCFGSEEPCTLYVPYYCVLCALCRHPWWVVLYCYGFISKKKPAYNCLTMPYYALLAQ